MWRSFLYVPGDRPAMIAKATTLTGDGRPDAVILDLEDAVAPAAKGAARAAVAALTTADAAPTGMPPVVVRINVGDQGLADVAAIAGPSLAAMCVAKATLESVSEVVAGLDERGCAAHIIALIETAGGVLDIERIAAHDRVMGLALGEADLRADLGIAGDADGTIWPIRSRAVVASVAAGIAPPTGPVSTDFHDLGAYRASTAELAAEGFGSRSAIHPDQVAVINEVMRPSAASIEAARSLVTRFDTAVANGDGVIVDDQGHMIDEAVVRFARRILDLPPI